MIGGHSVATDPAMSATNAIFDQQTRSAAPSARPLASAADSALPTLSALTPRAVVSKPRPARSGSSSITL